MILFCLFNFIKFHLTFNLINRGFYYSEQTNEISTFNAVEIEHYRFKKIYIASANLFNNIDIANLDFQWEKAITRFH